MANAETVLQAEIMLELSRKLMVTRGGIRMGKLRSIFQ